MSCSRRLPGVRPDCRTLALTCSRQRRPAAPQTRAEGDVRRWRRRARRRCPGASDVQQETAPRSRIGDGFPQEARACFRPDSAGSRTWQAMRDRGERWPSRARGQWPGLKRIAPAASFQLACPDRKGSRTFGGFGQPGGRMVAEHRVARSDPGDSAGRRHPGGQAGGFREVQWRPGWRWGSGGPGRTTPTHKPPGQTDHPMAAGGGQPGGGPGRWSRRRARGDEGVQQEHG
jgi:hypothetical protein